MAFVFHERKRLSAALAVKEKVDPFVYSKMLCCSPSLPLFDRFRQSLITMLLSLSSLSVDCIHCERDVHFLDPRVRI